jgi:nucleoid-associated protein YgaU
VYIESYNATLAGPDGSIYYDITLAQAIDVTVETVKKNKNTASKKRPSKNTNAKKYTVKKGDSLWSIARRFYKDSKKWKKIYTANKSKIEARAKKAGKKSSNKGHLLYPGTVLKIPS